MSNNDIVGRSKLETDEVSLTQCRRLAALLDYDPSALKVGAIMPFPWAAVLFCELTPQKDIAADGHARLGEFLPKIDLPRRRFAGRSISVHEPLRIGDALERKSTIVDMTEKQGRSGRLVFVAVQHDISGPSGLAIRERQNIAYLTDGPTKKSKMSKPEKLPVSWQASVVPDPVMLFRYSALTYNSHRIHYDDRYARDVEGYPDLVVNGGLTALLLLEGARKALEVPIAAYDVRAISPLFVGQTVDLFGSCTDDGAVLWAANEEGKTSMRIQVHC